MTVLIVLIVSGSPAAFRRCCKTSDHTFPFLSIDDSEIWTEEDASEHCNTYQPVSSRQTPIHPCLITLGLEYDGIFVFSFFIVILREDSLLNNTQEGGLQNKHLVHSLYIHSLLFRDMCCFRIKEAAAHCILELE